MRFLDAGQAIRFAEEYATRPDIGSQIGKLMRGLGGSGEIIFDVALSISARVAACEPAEAAAVTKAIYGAPDPERDIQVGWLIGERVRVLPSAEGRLAEQMHALGTATLKAHRAKVIYNDTYPLRRMAYDCGVTDAAFRKSFAWVAMRNDTVDLLTRWLKSVEYQIEGYLIEADMLIGESEIL